MRQGTCVGCGHVGVVPGLDAAGQPTCVRCSGIPINVCCRQCGREEPMSRDASCWRCLLRNRVQELLAGPDGTIPERLRPFADALTSMARPNSGWAWIRSNPKVPELLRGLATGQISLTHEALDELPHSRTVEYVRGLLVANAALPTRDPNLATFQRWLRPKLAAVTDEDQRKLIQRFTRWHLERQLHQHAQNGPVPTGAFLRAKQDTTVALQFLAWLDARGQTLSSCTQHDLDAWRGAGPTTRRHANRFLYWALNQRLLRNVTIAPTASVNGPVISEQQRLGHLRTLLTSESLPVAHRTIGCLVLLFGQPISKLVRLSIDDVQITDTSTQIRFGSSWVEVPEPVAVLLRTCVAERRYRTNTAANPTATWLFTGNMPGRPMHVHTVLCES